MVRFLVAVALLLPSVSVARDLILYGPGDPDANLEEALPKALKGLDVPPDADSDVRSFATLSLPTTTFLWAASGAELYLCTGATRAQSELVAMVDEGIEFMDYLEEDKARERFRAVEELLPCADEVLATDVLWNLYFSAAVLAYNAGEEEEAVRLFRAAALANPQGRWDESYNREAQSLYLRGREDASVAMVSNLRFFDPVGLITELYVDGHALALNAETRITADRHLIQARTRFGQFVSLRAVVTGSTDVLIVTKDGLAPLLLDWDTESTESATLRALATNVETSEYANIWLVDLGGKVRQVETSSWQFGLPLEVEQVARLAGKGKAGSGKPSPVSFDLMGTLQIYLKQPAPKPAFGGFTGLLTIQPAPFMGIELGLSSTFQTLENNDPTDDRTWVSWVPLIRVGVRFQKGTGPVKPYGGVAASITIHDQATANAGKVGVGPLALGGLRIKLGGPVHLRVDVAVGWNQGFVMTAGGGIGFGG